MNVTLLRRNSHDSFFQMSMTKQYTTWCDHSKLEFQTIADEINKDECNEILANEEKQAPEKERQVKM